jgi:hypothetical protein
MKFYEIALFVFLFNLSLGILNSHALFGGGYIQHDTKWQEDVQIRGGDIQSSYEINPSMIFGDFIAGLQLFFIAIANATVLLPFFLSQLGVPLSLNGTITAGTWFTYVVGIAQFISGRSVKAYE